MRSGDSTPTSDEDSQTLINNRQNGRRRGRGAQPGNNNRPNRPEQGNRIDNRARGNANQLHDKYKALARDAQMQGDRVLTEYYLQFADHYFRVLSESRARFEEQRRPRDENQEYGGESGSDDAFDDDFRTADALYRFDGNQRSPVREDEGGEGEERDARQPRGDDRPRGNRDDQRGPREDRGNRDRNRDPRQDRGFDQRPPQNERQAERPVRELLLEIEPRRDERPVPASAPGPEVASAPAATEERQPRRRGRPPRERIEAEADTAPSERIEADRLPPAVNVANDAPAAETETGEAPRKRRTRRPRAEGAEGDEAPVAA